MNIKNKWIVGSDPYTDDEQGYIVHRLAPEFIAKWGYEDEKEILSDFVFGDNDPVNPIAIYDFQFIDEVPSEEVLLKTCEEAIHAIDEYIQHRTDESRHQNYITKS